MRVRFMDGKTINRSRLIGAIKIGRPLQPKEIAHHLNGDPGDDSLQNIHVFPTQGEHMRWHARHPELRKRASNYPLVPLTVRLPPDLTARLREAALESDRSINGEMIQRLKMSLVETYRKL